VESPSVPQSFLNSWLSQLTHIFFYVKFSHGMLEAFVPPQHRARIRNFQVSQLRCGK